MRLYVKDFLASHIYDANLLRASEGYSTLCCNEGVLEQLDKTFYFIFKVGFIVKVRPLIGSNNSRQRKTQNGSFFFYTYH